MSQGWKPAIEAGVPAGRGGAGKVGIVKVGQPRATGGEVAPGRFQDIGELFPGPGARAEERQAADRTFRSANETRGRGERLSGIATHDPERRHSNHEL